MPAPRKVKAVVKELRFFEDNVCLYTLSPEIRCKFRSGQFLHLALDHYDPSFNWPESRVFSIACAPGMSDELKILVSKKGRFTQRMFKTLKEGSRIWLKLPYGDFNFSNNDDADLMLIAGGTGISPFIPFLEEYLHGKTDCNSVHLYYGIRNPDLLIYEELFNELQKIKPGFHLDLYIDQISGQGCNVTYARGMLPAQSIVGRGCSLAKPKFYLSGPPAMINVFHETILDMGFTENSIFFDKWE